MMGKLYDLPFGQFPGSFCITVPAWNMIYHCGQVNYVQLLYGDDVFHMPPS